MTGDDGRRLITLKVNESHYLFIRIDTEIIDSDCHTINISYC